MPKPANFSAFDGPGGEFSVIQNCPQKIKNLNLIKSVQKQNRKEKFHTSFFGFNVLDLKMVLIDSELNYASGNETYCY